MSAQSRASVGHNGDSNQMPQKKDVSKPATIRARDVLVTDLIEAPVITVGPKTIVRQVALLLTKNKISAVPVVDEGEVVGIVSEGDLIQRHELGRKTKVAEQLPPKTNADHSKSHGIYAGDVMTRGVLTVSEDTPLPDIVETLLNKNIRRVLVTRHAKLVGVVSRSDIVRVLAARPEGAGEPMSHDDDIIRFKVIETLMNISGINPWQMTVTVSKGIVELSGHIDDEAVRESSRIAIENVPHVVKVIDKRSSPQPYSI